MRARQLNAALTAQHRPSGPMADMTQLPECDSMLDRQTRYTALGLAWRALLIAVLASGLVVGAMAVTP